MLELSLFVSVKPINMIYVCVSSVDDEDVVPVRRRKRALVLSSPDTPEPKPSRQSSLDQIKFRLYLISHTTNISLFVCIFQDLKRPSDQRPRVRNRIR